MTQNEFSLEKLLLLFYDIDVKLNHAFKHISASFSKSGTLYKAIFKSLQTHLGNYKKLSTLPGVGSLNTNEVNPDLAALTELIQFHDAIEQRLKHIRFIHNDIIQDIIALKKCTDRKNEDAAYVRDITQINSAQVIHIIEEYTALNKKTDESLQWIKTYLASWETSASPAFTADLNEDQRFFSLQNRDLSLKILGAITAYEKDRSCRDHLLIIMGELGKALTSITAAFQIKEKGFTNNSKLKKLEDLYTTQGERDVFQSVVQGGAKSLRQKLTSLRNSSIDLF